MIFLNTVISLLNQKNITKNQLLKYLKLGKNSFVNWETRQTIPGGNTLLKLSSYFNVSVDYLIGNYEYCITNDEKILIEEYRKLNLEQQEQILKAIRKVI